MSSSAPDPRDAADARPPESPPPGPRPDEPRNRELFESVLERTLHDSNPGAHLAETERAALMDVVRRHRDEPFALEPTAVEMVHAVLRAHFPDRADSAEFWRVVAAQVAQTLFEDPGAHDRLEAFWRRLCGVVS